MPDSLQQVIRTQHPGIAEELQGAINTLRKLQLIAGVPSFSGDAGTANNSAQGTITHAPDADSSVTLLSDDPSFQLAQADVPVLAAGDSFGRYQIVRMLGKGAMGVVYLAYDGQLERHVALKQPKLTSQNMVQRFYREARATANLRSPYVCPVYDVGDINGMHFLSMSYIEGQTLSAAIREGKRKDPLWIAEVVEKIALGLQKAHQEGIIHRDLKPDNIMLDNDGDPVIMDFGLARRVDDDARLSRIGALIGSPAYMSPEQVEGDQSKIGFATDIYSLGVILFEMLTGRIPFTGSVMTVLRHVTDSPPPRPSVVLPELQHNPRFAELELHSLKMMAKKPGDRFHSAAEIADAMARLRHHGGSSQIVRGGWLRRIWPFRAAGAL